MHKQKPNYVTETPTKESSRTHLCASQHKHDLQSGLASSYIMLCSICELSPRGLPY